MISLQERMYLEKARGPEPSLIRYLQHCWDRGSKLAPEGEWGGAARRKEENQQCAVTEVILSWIGLAPSHVHLESQSVTILGNIVVNSDKVILDNGIMVTSESMTDIRRPFVTGRDWSNVLSLSQGMPRISGSHQKLEQVMSGSFLEPGPRKNMALLIPWFWTPKSPELLRE